MGTSIQPVTIAGATFISVGTIRLPLQSLIGDWEGGRWGDGKFPGIAAVAAVAALRFGASLTEDSVVSRQLIAAADQLAGLLTEQITAFEKAISAKAPARG